MGEQLFRCPFCDAELRVRQGGYAYMRSRVAEHLFRCAKKPPEVAKEDFWLIVDRVTAPDTMA